MNYQCESIVKTLLANYLIRNKLRLNELDYTIVFLLLICVFTFYSHTQAPYIHLALLLLFPFYLLS